ncbi:MAG TPA: hypothetical protein VFI13_05775, partial [Gemmatimonadales bacterium]|nr:hypothetical protein [Gemmatimonadales bacterium]
GDFDRYEEAVADYVAFQAEGQGRAWHDSAGADVTVRGGFTLLHPTDRTFGAENEFLFDYGVRFGHRWTRLEATAALSGRFFMTGCCGSFTQRNADQATFEFTWHAPITPRVGLRLPLTETPKNLYKSAVILGVSVPIE